jgi:hypothetical protein
VKIVNFQLNDSEGTAHRYEVELFSCDESAALQLEVAQPMMQVIGGALAAIMPALGGDMRERLERFIEGDTSSLTLSDVIEAVSRVNWADAPEAFLSVPRTILQYGGPAMVQRVFARTNRCIENKEAAEAPTASDEYDPYIRQPLADPKMRDMAFGDANYGEYWLAFVSVLLVNFTQRGRGELLTWSAFASHMTGGLWTRSSQITATTQQKNVSPIASVMPTS